MQQTIQIIRTYKATVDKVMNDELKRVLDKIPKKSSKAKQLISKFNESYDKLHLAIKYCDKDRIILNTIDQYMSRIKIMFNDKSSTKIYHIQLVRQDYFINLRKLIYQSSKHLFQDNNVYTIQFLSTFDQFDTKLYDISDQYIESTLQQLAYKQFKNFTTKMKTQKSDFEDIQFKIFLQAYRYKLITYLQDGKPAEIASLIENYEQLTPLIDEYNQKHTSTKSLLQQELEYYNEILKKQNINNPLNIENISQEDVQNTLQALVQ